jgi:hypothetical protein
MRRPLTGKAHPSSPPPSFDRLNALVYPARKRKQRAGEFARQSEVTSFKRDRLSLRGRCIFTTALICRIYRRSEQEN